MYMCNNLHHYSDLHNWNSKCHDLVMRWVVQKVVTTSTNYALYINICAVTVLFKIVYVICHMCELTKSIDRNCHAHVHVCIIQWCTVEPLLKACNSYFLPLTRGHLTVLDKNGVPMVSHCMQCTICYLLVYYANCLCRTSMETCLGRSR